MNSRISTPEQYIAYLNEIKQNTNSESFSDMIQDQDSNSENINLSNQISEQRNKRDIKEKSQIIQSNQAPAPYLNRVSNGPIQRNIPSEPSFQLRPNGYHSPVVNADNFERNLIPNSSTNSRIMSDRNYNANN